MAADKSKKDTNSAAAEASADAEVPQQDHEEQPEQPPLPDEKVPPPLPDEEAPPLPDSEDPPPLPSEEAPPPLPSEQPPSQDDGWEPVWDATAQAFYFYNRVTQKTQWENPRVPESSSPTAPGLASHDRIPEQKIQKSRSTGGYNPAIHGDYDPNADYAKEDDDSDEEKASAAAQAAAQADMYAAVGSFNRFTGKWQSDRLNPENFSDENKASRQMGAFFDVDAAANSHDGRSLKAERQNKKFSRKEIKAFKEKRREKKEEKRKAWLRD